ncbi:MAG: ATP-binding protein, partial [Deltaproteobacteria bacterium]|nr:ATP-binding protein [Deltaproteobacteria bacterium]
SLEHVRDLLELVRIRLVHRESVLTHAAVSTGLSPREVLAVGFLGENLEPHRVPMAPELAQAYTEGRELIARREALTDPEVLRFRDLAGLHGLRSDERALVLTALAPHFARGFHHAFERLVPGYETSRIPAGALADLVAVDDATRWRALAALEPDGKLARAGLLVRAPDALTSEALLACSPIAVAFLLSGETPPERPASLGGLARQRLPTRRLADLPLDAAALAALDRVSEHVGRDEEDRVRVAIVVTSGLDPELVAEGVAAAAGRRLVLMSYLAEGRSPAAAAAYRQVALFARLWDASVAIVCRGEVSPGALSQACEVLGDAPQVLVVSASDVPLGLDEGLALHHLRLSPFAAAQRRWVWADALGDGALAQRLGDSFALGHEEILQVAREGLPDRDEGQLRVAARKRLSAGLDGVAERIEARGSLEDLVIGPSCRAELDQLMDYVRHVRTVEARLGRVRARGTSALFHGPSGTGKTFAASVLARSLGKDLYRIDLAQVVDKYIGETEKKLDRVFTLAQQSDSVILFDEADSLFAKRQSEGGSSGERFANMQVNFLLQRMESYAGVSILTTNLLESIDTAFRRRIQFQVSFPRPDADTRRRLWERYLAALGLALSEDDVWDLGERFDLTGAHIENAVLKAAVTAEAAGRALDLGLLMDAATREVRALGGLVRQVS